MIYIEAPASWGGLPGRSIFLAGGITSCPDWQGVVVDGLRDTSLIVYNPRRENFPIDDPTATEEQIRWEFEYLKKADAILFWFSHGSLNPVVMFEYGKELGRGRNELFVGVDPEYPRAEDVRIQTALERPELPIHRDLHELIAKVRAW